MLKIKKITGKEKESLWNGILENKINKTRKSF